MFGFGKSTPRKPDTKDVVAALNSIKEQASASKLKKIKAGDRVAGE